MSKRSVLKLAPEILDTASRWFVEFKEESVKAGAREEFVEWLSASPEHVRAYLQISAHWEGARTVGRKENLAIEQLIAMGREVENIVSLDSWPGSILSPQAHGPGQAARFAYISRSLRFAAAAAVLVVASSIWFYSQRHLYTTDTGEQRSIVLLDGSSIDLNARSRIRVRFSDQRREVELLEGQALFSVAKDKARPFVVRSDHTWVKAIGTKFDVYKKSTGTIVSVVEGKVAVVADSGSALRFEKFPTALEAENPGLVLSAGEQLTVSASAVKRPVQPDVAAAIAWTGKKIIFRDTPLAEVIEEFNRYNTRQMIITDAQIKGLRISGAFSSTDPASLLRALDAHGTFIIQETGDEIKISPRLSPMRP